MEHQQDKWKLSADMCFGLKGGSGMGWEITNGDELIHLTKENGAMRNRDENKSEY